MFLTIDLSLKFLRSVLGNKVRINRGYDTFSGS